MYYDHSIAKYCDDRACTMSFTIHVRQNLVGRCGGRKTPQPSKGVWRERTLQVGTLRGRMPPAKEGFGGEAPSKAGLGSARIPKQHLVKVVLAEIVFVVVYKQARL